MFEEDEQLGLRAGVGWVNQYRSLAEQGAMTFKRDVEHSLKQRMTRCDQLGERLAFDVDEVLLESHALVFRQNRYARTDHSIPIAYLRWDEGDLEPAVLSIIHPAAEPGERLREPGMDVSGLELAGLGFKHVRTDAL
jgi:hypothetical protein